VTLRLATAVRAVVAGCCALAAGALVTGAVGMHAAAGYESRLEIEMARAGGFDCAGKTPLPSPMARLGLRLRGTSERAERWRLSTELARLSFHASCVTPASKATDNGTTRRDVRAPYAELLGKVRTLAAHDHGTERARTLGLLTLTLVRAAQVDSVNASSFVSEAETAARDAVRLMPADTLLQTNLELVLRMRRQEEATQRRLSQQDRGRRATKSQLPAQRAKVPPNRKHKPLPGPGAQGGGGY
jgi:hypothetical protein